MFLQVFKTHTLPVGMSAYETGYMRKQRNIKTLLMRYADFLLKRLNPDIHRTVSPVPSPARSTIELRTSPTFAHRRHIARERTPAVDATIIAASSILPPPSRRESSLVSYSRPCIHVRTMNWRKVHLVGHVGTAWGS